MDQPPLSIDIAIFGGGIAGLWALNRLQGLGYQSMLFDTDTLGGGQTIKSQGIIHGGIKYALGGFLSKSANAIENMPKRWKDCLQGKGEIDLQAVRIFSQDQLLYSTGNLTSEITSFFASLALNSRVKKLSRSDHPDLLKNPAFKGQVYRLDELVLDPHSLVEVLAKPFYSHIFKINPEGGYQFKFDPKQPEHIQSLQLSSGSQSLLLKAKHYVFTAGIGNEKLASHLIKPSATQRRPLQMVLVKLNQKLPFYAHCMDNGTNPRITITSLPTRDNKTIWYLGGEIAESGVTRSPAQQIEAAKNELLKLFPWLDLSQAIWSTFFVDRAEPKQPGGKRPETACMDIVGNALLAWPTKLALAPLLVDNIIKHLETQKTLPSEAKPLTEFNQFEKPSIALSLEEAMFN